MPVIHIIINSVKGREGGEKMSENKLKSRDAIDAELKKTKAELAIAKHREAKTS